MPSATKRRTSPDKAAKALLDWYDRHSRALPWRVSPDDGKSGQRADPYHVWLSEIMLQQTTVKTVGPYFLKFISAWPTLADLAAADTDDIMKAWAGLGYYSRARNLKKCAEVLVCDYHGQFPENAASLEKMPGIGAYTSAAIASIAFDEPVAVVDGNIERVVSRLHAIEEPLPNSKKAIKALVAGMTPTQRPGDFAQAMMDLGATICSPRRPACSLCPFVDICAVAHASDADTYPRKAPKKEKPTRYGAAFALFREDGSVLMRKRPEKGLLAGMAEIPTGTWTENRDTLEDYSAAPVVRAWTRAPELVPHTFTHFHLRLAVYHGVTTGAELPGTWWSPLADQDGEALPTLMRKVLSVAHDNRTKRDR